MSNTNPQKKEKKPKRTVNPGAPEGKTVPASYISDTSCPCFNGDTVETNIINFLFFSFGQCTVSDYFFSIFELFELLEI